MEFWLEWARGPAFIFSICFMILGLARHVVLTLWEVSAVLRRAGDKELPYGRIAAATLKWMFPIGRIREQYLFSLTSIVFHIAILAVPLFLAGHIALWYRGTGLAWPAIPNSAADLLTIAAVVTGVALVPQRLAARSTRALSRFQDYALPLVIALPFASGFAVMHPAFNPFSYDAVLLVHVLSANLVMVLMPLTKLTHAALAPSVQLVAELGWHWPLDAGSNVGVALGKEGVRI